MGRVTARCRETCQLREAIPVYIHKTIPCNPYIPGSAATDVATETAKGDAMMEEAKEYVVTEVAWGTIGGGMGGVVTVDHMDITGADSWTDDVEASKAAGLPPDDCTGGRGSEEGGGRA